MLGIYEEEEIRAVAKKIREHTEDENKTYTTGEMAHGVDKVYDKGYETGYNAGVAAQPTPTISVSSGGLITATAGGKSSTEQLPTMLGGTIVPDTRNYIFPAGRILLKDLVLVGDKNLTPQNIVSGATIFDVVGTAPSYDDGYHEGAYISIAPLLAQKEAQPYGDAADWGEGSKEIYEAQSLNRTDYFNFWNFVDYEFTDYCSNPYTIIVNNYHPTLHLHCYIYAKEHGTGEIFNEVLIIGPEETLSIDLECSDDFNQGGYQWQESLYWRYSIDGN